MSTASYPILLLLALLLSACSPLSQYNAKMERIDAFHQKTMANPNHSSDEKNKLFLLELKKEFPEDREGLIILERMYFEIVEKRENGLDVSDELEEANKVLDRFFAHVRARAYEDNERFVNSMHTLSQGLNETSRQINEGTSDINRSTINRLNDSMDRRKSTRCYTDFIGSTAYTRCY